MSYSGAGRSSFGRKGSSSAPQKKTRRKKQEYHTHKVGKFVAEETELLDIETLKERTILSLKKLGAQKFSPEPGGYGLENWLTSLNLLLDDFEEKIGKKYLPQEYFETRRNVVEELLKPVDVSDIENEIRKCQNGEREIELQLLNTSRERRGRWEKEIATDSESIQQLEEKRKDLSYELGEQERKLIERRDESGSLSFIRKIFRGSSSSSSIRIEERINEIKKSLEDIDRKIDSLKKRRDKVTSRLEYQVSPESEDARLAALLSDLRSKISELEEEKMRRLQISEKRINSTKQIAEIVAKIKTDGVAGDHPPDIQSPIEAQKSAYQEQDPQSVGT